MRGLIRLSFTAQIPIHSWVHDALGVLCTDLPMPAQDFCTWLSDQAFSLLGERVLFEVDDLALRRQIAFARLQAHLNSKPVRTTNAQIPLRRKRPAPGMAALRPKRARGGTQDTRRRGGAGFL